VVRLEEVLELVQDSKSTLFLVLELVTGACVDVPFSRSFYFDPKRPESEVGPPLIDSLLSPHTHSLSR